MTQLSDRNRALLDRLNVYAPDGAFRAFLNEETMDRLLDAARQEGAAEEKEERTYTQAEVDSILRAAFPFHTPAERAAILAPAPAAEAVARDPVFDALWDLVAAIANEGIPQTPRTKEAFKVAHEACLVRLRSEWRGNASPVRQEIRGEGGSSGVSESGNGAHPIPTEAPVSAGEWHMVNGRWGLFFPGEPLVTPEQRQAFQAPWLTPAPLMDAARNAVIAWAEDGDLIPALHKLADAVSRFEPEALSGAQRSELPLQAPDAPNPQPHKGETS